MAGLYCVPEVGCSIPNADPPIDAGLDGGAGSGTDAGPTVDGSSSTGTVLFVTSTDFQGSFGVDGADTECDRLSRRPALPGTYIALLSYPGTAAVDRVGTVSYPVVRPDGVVLERSDLWDGSGLDAALVDENGDPPSATEWWTGSTSTGQAGSFNCDNWTNFLTSTRGVHGTGAGPSWLGYDGVGRLCNNRLALLCIQVP